MYGAPATPLVSWYRFCKRRVYYVKDRSMTMSDEIGINRTLFDRTMGILSRTLDYRVQNQRVIASNIANIDTPGFHPKKLKFDDELRRAMDETQVRLKKTDRKHFPGLQEPGMEGQSFAVETESRSTGNDASLDIDREMAKMAKNNLLYEATVKMLSKKFDLLRAAIEGRR